MFLKVPCDIYHYFKYFTKDSPVEALQQAGSFIYTSAEERYMNNTVRLTRDESPPRRIRQQNSNRRFTPSTEQPKKTNGEKIDEVSA